MPIDLASSCFYLNPATRGSPSRLRLSSKQQLRTARTENCQQGKLRHDASAAPIPIFELLVVESITGHLLFSTSLQRGVEVPRRAVWQPLGHAARDLGCLDGALGGAADLPPCQEAFDGVDERSAAALDEPRSAAP